MLWAHLVVLVSSAIVCAIVYRRIANMPLLPLHPCSGPVCKGKTLVRGRSYCLPCARALEQRRGSSHERGYDNRWNKYRVNWLHRFPLCGMRLDGQRHAEHSRCTRDGRAVAAIQVDHIKPIQEGGLMWDPSNHQSLCEGCGARKSQSEGQARRNQGRTSEKRGGDVRR